MKKQLIPALIGLLLMSSCSEKGNFNSPEPRLSIVGQKLSSTFADGNSFSVGDKVGLYMTEGVSVLTPSANYLTNTECTYTTSGFTTSTAMTYPTGSSTVDIYAYYPYSSSGIAVNNALSFSVLTDQTVAGSDLLWVKKSGCSTTATSAVSLDFAHKLSKIVVNVIAGSGVTLSGTTVTINGTKPTVKMNMASGVLESATGSVVSIKSTKISDSQHYAIVIPQQINSGTANFITVTNGGKSYNYNLTESLNFLTGTLRTFDITVKSTGIDVKLSATIGGWNDSGKTNGDAF